MIQAEARGAWQELQRRLRPYVARRVASPDEIDDLLQEIFLRMHQGLGGLRDGDSFGGWVYRVANNVLIDRARARSRGPSFVSVEGADPIDPKAVRDAEALRSELSECVALFVGRLPSPYREAITLTELQGLTQRDAAEVLGVTLSGMKSRVQRGREKLRDMFEACCQISLDVRGRVMECEARCAPDASSGDGQKRRDPVPS